MSTVAEQHDYIYASGKLLRETVTTTEDDTSTTETLDFFYDANGTPYALKVNGTTYYYVTNLQGDVVRLVNSSGTVVASYEYDPYGNIISQSGDMAEVNPLRYRSYYFDSESGFYYLQSRYYDPEIGRFINADGYTSTGQGVIGYNMFAYCGNNPVCFSDPTGELTQGQIHDAVLEDIISRKQQEGRGTLSRRNTCIYKNGRNWRRGWGFCDLYDAESGEVWELKRNSMSYSCSTSYAANQLSTYIKGRLKANLDLPLCVGGSLLNSAYTFSMSDSNGTYDITYWEQGNGILRYDYVYRKNNTRRALDIAATVALVCCAGLLAASAVMTGGTTTPVAVAGIVAVIGQISKVA